MLNDIYKLVWTKLNGYLLIGESFDAFFSTTIIIKSRKSTNSRIQMFRSDDR